MEVAPLLLASLLFLNGCPRGGDRLTPEVILAVVSGDRPFTDSIIIVPSDGRPARTLLPHSWSRSYSGVTALSLVRPMVVRVRELEKPDTVKETLFDYDPLTRALKPWCGDTVAASKGGMGTLSPNGEVYAFPEFPSERPGITFVQCRLNRPTVTSKFQAAEMSGFQAWYVSPSWNPSGRDLAAVKVWRSGGIRGLRTEVQLINVDTKRERTILGSVEGAVATVFASDDKLIILTKRGIETLSIETGERVIVLPKSRLNERRYMSGGMAWLGQSDSVVVGLLAPTAVVGELWSVAIHNGSVKLINEARGLRFMGICAAHASE